MDKWSVETVIRWSLFSLVPETSIGLEALEAIDKRYSLSYIDTEGKSYHYKKMIKQTSNQI